MFELSPQYFFKRGLNGRCGVVNSENELIVGYYFDDIKSEYGNYIYYSSEAVALKAGNKWCLTNLRTLASYARAFHLDK